MHFFEVPNGKEKNSSFRSLALKWDHALTAAKKGEKLPDEELPQLIRGAKNVSIEIIERFLNFSREKIQKMPPAAGIYRGTYQGTLEKENSAGFEIQDEPQKSYTINVNWYPFVLKGIAIKLN